MLLPASAEDYLSEENPVRALDAFVDSLDLVELGFKMAGPNFKGGRPRFHSSILLKLYLWGYFARIRSSRRLEEACTSNLNAFWLTGNLAPDPSTISDFRKTNAKSLKSILRQFNLLCIKLKLFGRELDQADSAPAPIEETNSIQEKNQTLKVESKNYQDLREKCEGAPPARSV